MELFILWFAFAAVVGMLAHNRGRSGFGWFWLAALISPLIAVIALLIVGDKHPPGAAGAVVSADTRKCPRCAELVKNEANLCKHCGSTIEPAM
jgi:hypothetical protein